MSLLFRPYREPEDREATADIFAQIYRSGEPWAADEQVEDEDMSVYVGDLDGRIVAAWVVRHMGATLAAESSVRCGGVAGVAVRPDARSSGVGTSLMRWAIQRMRDDGYALSHLYAFRESWYRRLGWEVCGARMKIQCPQHRLPEIRSNLQAREVLGEGAWKVIEPVYQSFASNYSGMNVRTASQWVTVTRGTKSLARVFAIGDPAEAYCVSHVQTAFWEEQHVSEVAWSSREGYDALLAFLRSVASNKTALTWYEPPDSPFLAQHTEQGVKVSLDRPIMYRVLDLEVSLSALRPDGAGEFTMAVLDEDVPENRGPWRIAFGAHGIEIAKAVDADIEIDIRRLSQAVLGEPSFATLLRHGLIRCGSEGAAAAAAKLFSPRPVYCMDFF